MRKELKKFMIDNNLSRKDLADSLEVGETYLSAIISGKKNASFSILIKFNEIYKIGSIDKTMEIFKNEER